MKDRTLSDSSSVVYPETLWAGTEHSLQVAEQAYARILAGSMSGTPPAEDGPPRNLKMVGRVGVVSVAGPLVNRDSWLNDVFGLTSYQSIRNALVYAATDPNVGAIVLDVNSGGGEVSGVSDTARLISTINAKVKKVYAYAGDNMLSAAYWLGSAAGKVYGSDTSEVGSVGVILTHKEYSKAFKEAGIGVTVMRAGEYKALANPNEPLTDKAKEQVQASLDSAYQVFASNVADARGVTMAHFEAKMGQGRVFHGEGAVQAGMSDGVLSFDALITKIEKSLDTSENRANNPSILHKGLSMPKVALTEQQIAAIQSGAPLAAAAAAAEVVAPEAEVEAPAAEVAAAESEVPVEPAAEVKPAADAGVVAYLQGQLTAATEAQVTLKADLDKANAELAALRTTHAPLMKIAAQSVSNMRVGLGLAKIDLSAASAESLLADHAAMTETFTKSFKVGGVAAVPQADAVKDEAKPVSPLHLAHIAATRFSPAK